MNTLLKKWSALLLLAVTTSFMVSCDEDPVIDVIDGLPLADGYYLSLDGADPDASTQLILEKVELPGSNAPVDRDGFYGNYVFLTSGNYKLVEVKDREVVVSLGVELSDKDPLATNDPTTGFQIGNPSEDVGGFDLTSGLYKIAYDEETNEILVMEVETVSLIGSATEGGWGSDTELTAKGVATAEGFEFEGTEIILRSGAFKVRINNGWKMERFTEEGGYAAFTNYGGAVDLLSHGGADMINDVDGAYTVTVKLTNEGGAEMTLTRTGDAPEITFDPAEYNFGILGSATAGAWDSDQNMYYKGLVGGAHTWMGVVTFAEGVYKFRTNDSWDFNIGGAIDNLVAGGGDIAAPAAGDYFITISTANEGETWTASISEFGWAIVGAGSPAASWEVDMDLNADGFASGITTYSITGDFTTEGWKFRANNGWDYNIGGSLTALVPDGGDLTVSEAGNYTVVLSFDGTAYTATATKN